jgi:hypothetical protein
MLAAAQDIQPTHGKEIIVNGFGRKVQLGVCDPGSAGLGSGGAMPVLRMEALAGAAEPFHLFWRRGNIQFRTEGFHLIGRQRPQEALQENLGLPQAGVEIIVVAFECFPGLIRMDRLGSGEIVGFGVEFPNEIFERLGQDAEFLEETRTIGEEYAVQKLVPRRGALRGLAFEEFGIQGQDLGNVADVTATVRNRLASSDQDDRGAREQISGDGDLKSGADQFAPEAQGKCLVQGNAGHGVGRFPIAHYDVEEVSFISR